MWRQSLFGLSAHLRMCWPGTTIDLELMTANAYDLAITEQFLSGLQRWVLADRNCWSPKLTTA